ncbi:unnamed protein product [Blepharisma stoltei]|uniref:Secreted protein n=1 Tax=Blepharisma stoltei TaxID=1481888 RepID=A0AAU9JGI7_9CILI|nr:unnamed protein product [Blepharisma stoltei]
MAKWRFMIFFIFWLFLKTQYRDFCFGAQINIKYIDALLNSAELTVHALHFQVCVFLSVKFHEIHEASMHDFELSYFLY